MPNTHELYIDFIEERVALQSLRRVDSVTPQWE